MQDLRYSVTKYLKPAAQAQAQPRPLRRTMNAPWPQHIQYLPVCLAAVSILHSPRANTQLCTDKATLLVLSQLVSLAKCVNHSLSVPLWTLSASDSFSPPFWSYLYGSISSFYLPPISPHPISNCASIAPWEEEDIPSCCAQVCLSEVL